MSEAISGSHQILQPSFEEYNKLKKDSRIHPDERSDIGISSNFATIF
jgi:hypothetical protein